MAKVTIQTEDGEQKEVEVNASDIQFQDDESPQGFVSQSKLNNDILPDRLSRKERTVKEKLQNDEDFIKSAAQKMGIGTDTKASELKQKAAQADKYKQEANKYKQEVESLRDVQLENEMLNSGVTFRDDLKDVAKSYIKSNMSYDKDYGFVKKDTDGDIEYTEDGTPMTAQKYVKNYLPNEKPSFFKSNAMKPNQFEQKSNSFKGAGKKTYTKEEASRIIRTSDDEEAVKDAQNAYLDGRVTGLE